jgi:hypothetical protein
MSVLKVDREAKSIETPKESDQSRNVDCYVKPKQSFVGLSVGILLAYRPSLLIR